MIHDFWEIIDKYDGWNRLNIQAIILNIKMVHFICQQTKILKLDGEGKTAIVSLQSVYKEHTYWGWCHGKIKKKWMEIDIIYYANTFQKKADDTILISDKMCFKKYCKCSFIISWSITIHQADMLNLNLHYLVE